MDRNTFKSYLKKIQELQVLAYEHGLNFELASREADTKEAWLYGYVKYETADFEGPGIINFAFYDFMSAKKWDKELLRIKEWIINNNNL